MLSKLQVLLQPTTQRVPAALSGLATFVETLRLLVEAQQAVATAAASSSQLLSGGGQPDVKGEDSDLAGVTPMEEGVGRSDAGVQEKAASKAMTGISHKQKVTWMKLLCTHWRLCSVFPTLLATPGNSSVREWNCTIVLQRARQIQRSVV